MGSIKLYETPQLVNPSLIMGLRGRFDTQGVSTIPIQHLYEHLKPRKIGEIARGEFYINSLTPPHGSIRDGYVERLVYPRIEIGLWEGYKIPRQDLVLLSGDEPNNKWKRCATDIVELAKRLGVQTLFTIGGHYIPVPHTREVSLHATFNSSSSKRMLEKRSIRDTPDYEGSLSFNSVLLASGTAHGLNTVGLWIGVPTYWGMFPFPYVRGCYAVLKTLQEMLDIDLHADSLRDVANTLNVKVDEMISQHQELKEMLSSLERAYDEGVKDERLNMQLREILRRKGGLGSSSD